MSAGGALMIDEAFFSQAPASATAEKATRYLQPGFLHVARATTITTILGSCVAVCLWDASRRTGGMNHFLLPRGAASPESEGRFGETAVPRLIEQLIDAGAGPGRLEAKIFGGACIAAALQRQDHLGLKNVDIAVQILDQSGIAIVAMDVGGTRGRKVLFHTGDGTVLVKYL